MVEKKESFDEKCRRLGLFDKSIGDIIDMIAERDKEIERLSDLLWGARCVFCGEVSPICNGIKPGHGRNRLGELPDNQGLFKSCELAKALVKEDRDD